MLYVLSMLRICKYSALNATARFI